MVKCCFGSIVGKVNCHDGHVSLFHLVVNCRFPSGGQMTLWAKIVVKWDPAQILIISTIGNVLKQLFCLLCALKKGEKGRCSAALFGIADKQCKFHFRTLLNGSFWDSTVLWSIFDTRPITFEPLCPSRSSNDSWEVILTMLWLQSHSWVKMQKALKKLYQ